MTNRVSDELSSCSLSLVLKASCRTTSTDSSTCTGVLWLISSKAIDDIFDMLFPVHKLFAKSIEIAPDMYTVTAIEEFALAACGAKKHMAWKPLVSQDADRC